MSIPDISRRALLRGAASAATAVIGAPFLNLGRSHLFGWSPQEYTTRCIDLVRGSLVIDMLGLTTLNGRTLERWSPDFSGLTAEDADDFRETGIGRFHIAPGVG